MSEIFGLSDLLGSLIELERSGQRLYDTLAATNTDKPELCKLFKELYSWEKQHEELYVGYLAVMGDVQEMADDQEYRDYLRSLVQSAMHLATTSRQPTDSTGDILRLALQIEKDTVLFLREVIPCVPERFGADSVLSSVLREEQRHVVIIQSLLSNEPNAQEKRRGGMHAIA